MFGSISKVLVHVYLALCDWSGTCTKGEPSQPGSQEEARARCNIQGHVPSHLYPLLPQVIYFLQLDVTSYLSHFPNILPSDH